MSKAYKYLDPDYAYTNPKTGILRNLQDITDADVLLFVEKCLRKIHERNNRKRPKNTY